MKYWRDVACLQEGYAWNVEDDDTKNVRLIDGLWTISQRNKLIYSQKAGN